MRRADVGHDAPMPTPTDEYRRTRLANERTFLAWWRTGLASYAVAIALGRFLPRSSRGQRGSTQLWASSSRLRAP